MNKTAMAWVLPHSTFSTISCRRPRPCLSSLSARNVRFSGHVCARRIHSYAVKMQSSSNGVVDIAIMHVPTEREMLTFGETRSIQMGYNVFLEILGSGCTMFGCLTDDDWLRFSQKPRGALLSIMGVKRMVQNSSQEVPSVVVECRCDGRFDLLDVKRDETRNLPNIIMHASARPVHDWVCWEIKDRLRIAELECMAWRLCRELSALLGRLAIQHDPRRRIVETELSVWAPNEYDTDISKDDWEKTPQETRTVWCQRAESFSFCVLRCAQANDSTLRQARNLTSTRERLLLGIEALHVKKAETAARLSLQDAIG